MLDHPYYKPAVENWEFSTEIPGAVEKRREFFYSLGEGEFDLVGLTFLDDANYKSDGNAVFNQWASQRINFWLQIEPIGHCSQNERDDLNARNLPGDGLTYNDIVKLIAEHDKVIVW